MSDSERRKREPRSNATASDRADGGALLPPDRLVSVDAYRGFVMLLMMAEVLQFSRVSAAFPESGFWKFLAFHQSHVEWRGCSLHDLIQPSFSFLVGLSLPFSIASRRGRGDSIWWSSLHALLRAVILVFLGIWLRSTHSPTTNWTFEDTLSQIGLGYLVLYVSGYAPRWAQWTLFGLLVVGYWGAFVATPLPAEGFDYDAVKVSADWAQEHNATGLMAHWNKNSNLAWQFDRWFLNRFPRVDGKEWIANGGGYATLSFIPTLATMVLGLLAGGIARNEEKPWKRVGWFVGLGAVGLALGYAADAFGICPNVKRIWTPTWVLWSGGCCFLLLSLFYIIIDIGKLKTWAYPLIVIGMNSIAAYCLAHGFDSYLSKNLATHFGGDWAVKCATPIAHLLNDTPPAVQDQGADAVAALDPAIATLAQGIAPLIHGGVLLALLWLILNWMYRRRVFVRI